ncbi:MAG: hypothetical protein AABW41_05640 [Nanoarchaeota archaeon]
MKIKRPDSKNALSLIVESEREMKFTLTIALNEDSTSTIVRNIYECFRMLGEAVLINKGFESKDHVESINALLKINVVTIRPINVIDNLRRLRHNINYYGYHPTIAETKDAIDIANSCFNPLLSYIKKTIQNT